jgi:glyoxylase-like metal-dependent hydrolase (beta-lactamase superfamily II)
MKIIALKGGESVYTCNAYLVLGTWNNSEDVNALVDIGANGSIIDSLEIIRTGVGKKPVERVIITHNHFDHTGGLSDIKKKYRPEVMAFQGFNGVDTLLRDGQTVRLGDRDFEVIHAPGHSEDSICLYCAEDRALFSGDTDMKIASGGGGYSAAFIRAMERIAEKDIAIIYSGHDMPRSVNIKGMLRTTLANLRGEGLSRQSDGRPERTAPQG